MFLQIFIFLQELPQAEKETYALSINNLVYWNLIKQIIVIAAYR